MTLNLLLDQARKTDNRGKKSKWYMPGGEERQEASALYRFAIRVALQIHGSESLEVAKVMKEVAHHFEERHCEKGRPENSRWNRCAAIPEN